MMLDSPIACNGISHLHVQSSCVSLNSSFLKFYSHSYHNYTFLPFHDKCGYEYPLFCYMQSDNYNGHMRACLSYQCCSKTDLLVIIIIFVSVKLTSQKILEGEKRSNLRLKKNVKLKRELDTAKVNCRNPNSTGALIVYSGCKYWFSCHQNKYLNYFLARLQIIKLGTPQVVNIEIGVTKQLNNNSTQKIFGPEKKFDPKKNLVPKKNNLSNKKVCSEKNVWSEKNFGRKKKEYCPKNIFGPKKFLIWKNICSLPLALTKL